jgi:predicted DCC family thiol-disulfide oxidoreductase YuxK
MRFSPIQTDFSRKLCKKYGMPIDLSTGVLIDEKGGHKDSTAILRILPYMGFPYNLLGPIALFVPKFIRDCGYRLFARNRGFIWKQVKRVTGLGDTQLEAYRDRIVGLEDPLDPGWGFNKFSPGGFER